MPYIAKRVLYDQGVTYQPGDPIPCEEWPSLYALRNRGDVVYAETVPEKQQVEEPEAEPDVEPEKDPEAEPEAPKAEGIGLTAIKIDDLDEYLAGITDVEVLETALASEPRAGAKRKIAARVEVLTNGGNL